MRVIYDYWAWLLWSIIDLLCIYQVMHVLFDIPKRKPRKRIWLYILFYIIISLLRPYALNTDNKLGILVALFIVVSYYIKAFPIICECLHIKKKGYILINMWLYEEIIGFLADTLFYIFDDYVIDKYNSEIISDLYNVIFSIIISVIVLVGIYIVKKIRKVKQVSLYFHVLSFKTCAILSIAIFCLIMFEAAIFGHNEIQLNIQNLKVFMIILIITFISMILILLTTSQSKQSVEKVADLLAEQVENMTSYYTQLNTRDEEMRRFKHDIKNLLLGLTSMIEKGDTKQTLEYIESMGYVYKVSTKVYDSGNYIADAIFSTKSNIAGEYNIMIDFEGFLPAQKIKDTDMCIFLTNALDNAIEACQEIQGEKHIQIQSQILQKMWMITITNPINREIKIKNNHVETSKREKELHGYGLLNMKRVVEKYNGHMNVSSENNNFILKASFQLREITNKV